MRELTNDKIQELVELVGHGSVSVKHRNQKIREWIAINTRPNDAKKMIAEGLETELAKTHDTIMVAIWEKCEHLHPSVISTVLDALLEICKQSSEGEEG